MRRRAALAAAVPAILATAATAEGAGSSTGTLTLREGEGADARSLAYRWTDAPLQTGPAASRAVGLPFPIRNSDTREGEFPAPGLLRVETRGCVTTDTGEPVPRSRCGVATAPGAAPSGWGPDAGRFGPATEAVASVTLRGTPVGLHASCTVPPELYPARRVRSRPQAVRLMRRAGFPRARVGRADPGGRGGLRPAGDHDVGGPVRLRRPHHGGAATALTDGRVHGCGSRTIRPSAYPSRAASSRTTHPNAISTPGRTRSETTRPRGRAPAPGSSRTTRPIVDNPGVGAIRSEISTTRQASVIPSIAIAHLP